MTGLPLGCGVCGRPADEHTPAEVRACMKRGVERPSSALDVGDVILLDAVGAQVVRMEPSGEVGIIVDLEGKLNKLDIRDVHRYAMPAGMAAELIAEIVVAAQVAAASGSALGFVDALTFSQALEAAIGAEQARRGLT